MNFLSVACTDVGIKKEINEDSYLIKIAECDLGQIAFAAICDGMGGLSKGEFASSSVIKRLSVWFNIELPKLLVNYNISKIIKSLERLITDENIKLIDYGKNNGIKLGTTLTAILIIDSKDLLIFHIGDSRVYEIGDEIIQLSEDQTLVAREIKRGKLTEEEAKYDKRRSILLQCIGGSKYIKPEIIVNKPEKNKVYLLCSDGFTHEITSQEILGDFNPEILVDEHIMRDKVIKLINTNKERKERDNITVILIKAC